jgi:hypothetical protein
MSGRVLRADWYRFRATLRQRIGAYLALTFVLAIVGGVALASLAGARRTQSSFETGAKLINAADTNAATAVLDPTQPGSKGYDPAVIAKIAHIPGVKAVANEVGLDVSPLENNGAPLSQFAQPGAGYGSVDGAGLTMQKLIPLQGRLPDPNRADEFFSDPVDARQLNWHVGSVVTFGVYTNAQTGLPDFGTPKVPPTKRVQETLVGIGVDPVSIIQDDADVPTTLEAEFFTPAFTRPLLNCCANYTSTYVKVDKGARLSSVRAAGDALLPKGYPAFGDPDALKARVARTIRPDTIALGVFGAIAALAALVIAALMVTRYVGASRDERAVLRGLGAAPALTSTDGLIGLFGAIALGALGAVIVAIAISPLGPIGPYRRVLPRSIAADWTVLGFGFLALFVVLAGLAVIVSIRTAPHRMARRRTSTMQGAVGRATSGLPTSTAMGVSFALDSGSRANSAPVRSAIVGAMLSVVVVVATLTFGASFHALITRPALYGWNWDSALVAGTGVGDIPQDAGTKLVNNDHDIAVSSAVYFATVSINGQPVPAVSETPGAAVQPAVISGHGLQHADEIVLGEGTLAAVHKHIGDTVTVAPGVGPATTLHIVGTAALPAIGVGGESHMEMGNGAVIPLTLIPDALRNPFHDPLPGPNAMFLRWKPGTNVSAASHTLNSIAQQLSNNANFGVQALAVQRPAEIVNYRTMGTTPLLLSGALALGAIIALLLTLLASVRRRRRDLALLKTLGFTRGQLASTVTWQSTVAVAIGLVVGIPLGVFLGRELWIQFANEIHVVPTPTVSALALLAVVVGGLGLAVVISLLPARVAARTPAAVLLRAD